MKRKYRVWFAQVNQTYVDVFAHGDEQARQIAREEWRRDYGTPHITDSLELLPRREKYATL